MTGDERGNDMVARPCVIARLDRAIFYPISAIIFSVSALTMDAPAANVPMLLPKEERTKTKSTRVMRFE